MDASVIEAANEVVISTSFYNFSSSAIVAPPNLNDCYKAYAAYDIGSGATKFIGAIVNQCLPSIEEVFSQGALFVPYREDLLDSSTGEFSDLIMEMGLTALKTAKEKIEYDFDHFNVTYSGNPEAIGVATAAFRMAANADNFIDVINEELGIPVTVISQEEEAKLAYYSAIDRWDNMEGIHSPVVWDIGGGSMQFTTQDENSDFQILGSNLASANFAALLSEEFSGAKSTEVTPLGKDNMNAAIDLAKEHLALYSIGDEQYIKNKLMENPIILAVGAVHNSLAQAVNTLQGYNADDHEMKSVSKQEVYQAIELLVDKNEHQIDRLLGEKLTDFSKYQLSNMVLVYAAMDLLGINQITTMPVNNIQGLLLQHVRVRLS